MAEILRHGDSRTSYNSENVCKGWCFSSVSEVFWLGLVDVGRFLGWRRVM